MSESNINANVDNNVNVEVSANLNVNSELAEKKIEEQLVNKLKIKDDESTNSHIKNIDLYDRLNFQRIQVKRSSLKAKTNVVQPKLNITKYTEDIIKYVEEIPLEPTSSSKNIGERKRQRTIKFSTQKVTFQYPKKEEAIKSLFGDIKEEEEEKPNEKVVEENENENDEDEVDGNGNKKGIFIFGGEDDDEEHHNANEDNNEEEVEAKQHINLNIYEEKH